MYLTLEIVTGPSTASLAKQSHTFGIEGGRIGRAQDNDWQIAYEFIHSKHAGIRFFNGLFYVEKLGSNVVAIGSPNQDLKTGDSFPLLNGSRLYLDEFELSVAISADPPSVARVAMQPPADFDARFTETGVHSPLPELQAGFGLGGDGGSRLDDFLRDPTPTPQAPRGYADQVNHLDGLYDRMSLPGAAPSMAPSAPSVPSADMFADGWDKTNFSAPKPKVSAPPPPLPPPTNPADFYESTGLRGGAPAYDPRANTGAYERMPNPPGSERTGPGWRPPPSAPPPPAYDRTPPAPPPTYDRTGPGQIPAQPGYDRTGPGWAPPPPPAHAAPRPAHVPPPPPAHAGPMPRELAGLLAAFGVDPGLLAPGDIDMFGRALRQAVAGTIAVLQNRSEMRARFRLSGTRLAHDDPNPLKIAPNLDDAMHEFFRRRQHGKMPLDVAVGAALQEVQWHEFAMLDAMEAAFNSVLDRLDPAQIESLADKAGRRGALSSRPAHLWETYSAVYRQMAADRGEAYRKQFGDAFAKAYDQALERRRNVARNTRG